jgi:hypothetical protein
MALALRLVHDGFVLFCLVQVHLTILQWLLWNDTDALQSHMQGPKGHATGILMAGPDHRGPLALACDMIG